MPETFRGPCNIYINDRDIDVVFRAAILLLLALSDTSYATLDCIIHLWYSAFLTAEHRATIHRWVRPLISEVVTKIQEKKEDAILAKTFPICGSSIRIMLQKAHWLRMLDMLDRDLEYQLAKSNRHDIISHRTDHLHRDLFNKRNYERAARWKFRQTGILLPFGADLTDFVVPNM